MKVYEETTPKGHRGFPGRAFLLLCLLCLLGTAPAYAQQRITHKFNNATMVQVLEVLKARTGYQTLYNSEEVARIPRVTKEFTNVTIEEVLGHCLKGTRYTYGMVNKIIVIKVKPSDGEQLSPSDVLNRKVSGRVLDQDGLPLPGATVMLKQTSRGITTSPDGSFSFTFLHREPAVLVFSFLGMESQEVVLSKNGHDDTKPLTIRLKENPNEVAEVVVTGYANIDKKGFTGNTVTVTNSELMSVSKTNVLSALQVFDPSFRLQENTTWGSDPNAVPELYIRGRSGIGVKELDGQSDLLSKSQLKNNPNLPLFIMDGFEISVTQLYDYDPNRIENVTILKDAAATAMYGSRAANGVVIITTVPPTPGKLFVSYNMTGTVSMPDLSDYNLMNAREKLETEFAAKLFESDKPNEQYALDREYNAKLTNVLRGVDTYWPSQPLRTSFSHKHSAQVAGGINDLRFAIDLSYNNTDGVMKGSARDRLGLGLTLSYQVGKLQIRNQTTYYDTKSTESPYGNFADYTSKLPYDEIKDENGNYLRQTAQWHTESQESRLNPLYEASLKSFDRSHGGDLTNNLGLNWFITPYLQLKGQFSLTKTDSKSERFIDPLSSRNTLPISQDNLISGELYITESDSFSWDTYIMAAYNQNIRKHNINLSLGVNAQSDQSNSASSQYRGFPSGDFSSPNFAQDIYEKPVWADGRSRLFGALMQLNYTYDNIYLFDMSVRADGSSKFGSESKTAYFWSMGAGLALHNYEFFKKQKAIDDFKIRGSYGLLGKVNFEPFAAKTIYQISGSDWYETGMGATLMALGNHNLGWEKTYQLDVGFELGLLDRLFYITASYYNKRTVDLVNDVTIASSSGFTTYKDNVGEMLNEGVDISVRSNIIRRKNLRLSLYGSMSHNVNKLTKISNTMKAYNDLVDAKYEELKGDPNAAKPFRKYAEGQSITALSAVRSHGIDPATGDEILQKLDGSLTTEWNSEDMVYVGDTDPAIQGSFGFSINWKRFSLFTTFLYEYGGQRYNQTLVSKVENADIYNTNVDRRVFTDRWKSPGDITRFKSLYADRQNQRITKTTSRFVEDYNLLSLNSITLGYEVNPQALRKFGISMLRFDIGANDIFRFCTVKQERGLSYPYARMMNFSIRLTF